MKTDFVKVSAWSGISTFVKMVTGFVSIKVVANIIGPGGIAMVGQFLNSITMISTLGTGGIGQGVTKYIAEHYNEPLQQTKVISHAVKITLFATVLMSLLVIFFSSPLGFYIFKTQEYNDLIILFGISIALYSLNSLLISILNGFKSFRKFVILNITISLAGLVLSLLLVTQFGLYGALLNCIAGQSVIIIITILFVYKEPWFPALFKKVRTDWSFIEKLGGFTLMTLTSAILVPFTQLSIRTYLADNLSLHDAGIWEGMNRLSGMYLMLITSSIGIYYMPRLAEIKEDHLLRQEIIKTGKIVLPPLALACLFIFLSRDILIRLVFSKEFMEMRELFAFQMIGDFFKMASWLIAFLFWAKGMTRMFIISEIIFSITLIVLTRLSINYFGLPGSVYGYCINYMIYFIVMLIIFRKLLFRK